MYSSEEVVRTSQEKLVSFIKENRTSLFAGAVVTAIGITAARDRSSTSLSQKFMNVRLIGQMVGIAAIVALATLSSSER